MQTIVIYHRSDFDGIFCREVARKFLPQAELIGWEYGDPVPSVPEEAQLYILDLSVEGLMQHPNLIWIDHHKSAIDKYPSTIKGYRIDGVAACRLAWQWFAKKKNAYPWTAIIDWPEKQHFVRREVEEPIAVRLAGEYDIWDRRNPDAELFQHGLRSQDLEPLWEILLSGPFSEDADGKVGLDEITVDALLEAGRALQYAKTKENESIIKAQSFRMQWEGLRFLCCNHARFNSFLFTAGLTPDDDACLGFCWDGRKWKVSLYHATGKEHIDLSVIAVKHGGGGHRGACGFACDTLPFPLKTPSDPA